MSTTYITTYFPWVEFWCHDGTEPPEDVRPNIRRLCETTLEPIRDAWGGPVIVVSGWRSIAWNHKCGGATGSRHLTGEAADIAPSSKLRLPAFKAMIDHMIAGGHLPALGGLGWYPNRWIHVDIRAHDGHIAKWEGHGTGAEVV